MQDIIIIGGGLAGLVAAIDLRKRGFEVLLIEKKTYPFHKVCGEYVSNEVKPYLQRLGLDVSQLGAKQITRFQFSSPSGKSLETPLDLGGFGISRFVLDQALYQLGLSLGINYVLGQSVTDARQEKAIFEVYTSDGQAYSSKIVLGSYGKRSNLDVVLERDFFKKRSPYIGVKYHIQTDFPQDLIALHNFKDGYCGISAIEGNTHCLCYLSSRKNLKKAGSIENLQKNVLSKNPHLKKIFEDSIFLYDKPEVINEISFAPKKAVENGILMIGDAAGLITPLCGNGMAMAIHGAKIVSGLVDDFLQKRITKTQLEQQYQQAWQSQFGQRLWVGRNVQRFFGSELLSELALLFFKTIKPALGFVIKLTHGKEF